MMNAKYLQDIDLGFLVSCGNSGNSVSQSAEHRIMGIPMLPCTEWLKNGNGNNERGVTAHVVRDGNSIATNNPPHKYCMSDPVTNVTNVTTVIQCFSAAACGP